jgi:hypothetical protein
VVKFICDNCGRKLNASPDLVGHRCKCSRCGNKMTVPSASDRAAKGARSATPTGRQAGPHLPPPLPASAAGSPAASAPPGPVSRKLRFRLIVSASLAAGLLAVVALVVFLASGQDVDRKLNDLKSGDSSTRRQALVWLADADVDPSHRAPVTAALEPVIFEGDVRGDLTPELVLRTYLHWAGPDNVPALVRLVQSPPAGLGSRNVGSVMQTLGKLQDSQAANVLAEKLRDPALGDQAVAALRLMGPGAENTVLDYVFDGDPAAAHRASQLLGEYGTNPNKIAGAALSRLKSPSPDAQRSAAVWLAENPPDDPNQQAAVAKALTALLDDLSPKVNALALRALKLWATKDSLPPLVALARRGENAGACAPELIDVLAWFPDDTAAAAIALQLKTPANRGRAAQALLKLGPVATNAVLPYVDHPDPAVQKEARRISHQLNAALTLQVDRILADLTDARKPRARAALRSLAQLRPQEASRAKVSEALNASLLDSDPAIVTDALNAVRVWGSRANTATLLKLLAKPRIGVTRDCRVIDLLGSLQDPAAAPALAEGLTRPEELDASVKALVSLGPGAEEAIAPYLRSSARGPRFAACWVLGEVGTARSLPALKAAREKFLYEGDFCKRTDDASDKITARQ